MVRQHLKQLRAGGRSGSAVTGLASMVLRGFLLLGKFAFMLALARFTDPATIGIYALLVTIVTIAIYVIGLEIHTFTTREIVSDDGRGAEHVQHHFLTIAVCYLLSLPLIYGIGIYLGISGKFSFIILAPILLCECLGQELSRYLLVMMRPVASNLLQFIRGAAWMPIPLAMLLAGATSDTIDAILWSWLAGTATASGVGLWLIRQYLVGPRRFKASWLGDAFNSARHYFIVAVLSQVQFYSDRFIVQKALGETDVGVYSFYQSFATTVMTFVQTGVIAVLLPRLLRAARQGDGSVEQRTLRTMAIGALSLGTVISTALAVGMPYLLVELKGGAYSAALPTFYILLAGNLMLIAGLVPHFGLYARRHDAALMRVALGLIPFAVAVNILVIPRYGILGASITFALTALLEFVIKAMLLRRLRHRLVVH